MAELIYHYTEKNAFNTIRSQIIWTFIAAQPPGDNEFGVYFTNLLPDNRQLCKKLRIPSEKVEFCFEVLDAGDIQRKEGGRGAYVFFNKNDFSVEKDRQRYHGLSKNWKKAGAK